MMEYPGPSKAEMKKHEAECDLRTLIDAARIKKDKARYAAAMKARTEQMAAMQAIGDEKAAAKKG